MKYFLFQMTHQGITQQVMSDERWKKWNIGICDKWGPPEVTMGAPGTGGLLRGALLLLSLQAPQLLGGQGEGGGVTLHCTEEGGVVGGVPKGMDQVGKGNQFCAGLMWMVDGAVQSNILAA